MVKSDLDDGCPDDQFQATNYFNIPAFTKFSIPARLPACSPQSKNQQGPYIVVYLKWHLNQIGSVVPAGQFAGIIQQSLLEQPQSQLRPARNKSFISAQTPFAEYK